MRSILSTQVSILLPFSRWSTVMYVWMQCTSSWFIVHVSRRGDTNRRMVGGHSDQKRDIFFPYQKYHADDVLSTFGRSYLPVQFHTPRGDGARAFRHCCWILRPQLCGIYLTISLIINEIIIALCLTKYHNQVTTASKFTEFRNLVAYICGVYMHDT